MKRYLSGLAIAAILTMFTPLFVTASAAQMTCHIPFSFSVNGKALPPGLYTFATRDRVLIVSGPRGAVVMTQDAPGSPVPNQVKVVFNKTGERYELAEAWTGQNVGRALPQSGQRAHHARAANTPVERVVIAGM